MIRKRVAQFLALQALFGIFVIALAGPSPVAAQMARKSPHETFSAVVTKDKKRITITYGRPNVKGREIWGKLVPYTIPWRVGADEATTMISEVPLEIGKETIPPGAYTLYAVPSEKGPWQLAVSKRIGQWGIPVDEKNDLVRVEMKKDTLENKVEQLTLALEPKGDVVNFKISWDDTQFSVPFTVVKK